MSDIFTKYDFDPTFFDPVTEAVDISQGRFDHLRKQGKEALDKQRKQKRQQVLQGKGTYIKKDTKEESESVCPACGVEGCNCLANEGSADNTGGLREAARFDPYEPDRELGRDGGFIVVSQSGSYFLVEDKTWKVVKILKGHPPSHLSSKEVVGWAKVQTESTSLKESRPKKSDKIKIRLAKHGSQFVPSFFDSKGQQFDPYINILGRNRDEVMNKVHNFYPKAELIERLHGNIGDQVAREVESIEDAMDNLSSLMMKVRGESPSLANAFLMFERMWNKFFDIATDEIEESIKKITEQGMGSEARYIAGYETGKQDRANGIDDSDPKDNPNWLQGYKDAQAGKPPKFTESTDPESILEPGFVKTPADEKKWQRAKEIARKQNPDDFYALSNHIYHSMKGE